MGNSTISIQKTIDFMRTIGDLAPVVTAGGFSNLVGLTIANDVLTDMMSQRFNWKFNRVKVPPFYTISFQQDYASLGVTNIGWLEHGIALDINNTALPKPIFWLEAVRDLERTSFQFGKPCKVCWLPNDQLEQGVWPGAAQRYTNPVGAVATPSNPMTNIRDANNNILVLTTYGVTGGVAPLLAANSAAGTTVNDGSCVWTVADPKAQGFRLSPLPPQTGVVYQMNVVAQARMVPFTDPAQMIDPIPDDYAKYFRDGYMTYLYRHSTAPVVRERFEKAHLGWLQSMADARGQGDREKDDAGFVPASNIMQDPSGMPVGPAWPYNPY